MGSENREPQAGERNVDQRVVLSKMTWNDDLERVILLFDLPYSQIMGVGRKLAVALSILMLLCPLIAQMLRTEATSTNQMPNTWIEKAPMPTQLSGFGIAVVNGMITS